MPKLALCNIFPDPKKLKAFALGNGFSGIDWSFDMDALPEMPMEISAWQKDISKLEPLEVRYHCPFLHVDLGHSDPAETQRAIRIFRHLIHLISKAGGKYLTIHIGLGHNSTTSLSWNQTMVNLRDLVAQGAEHGVRICLENLAWGWTSRPNLFEKLIRGSGAGVTLDIGHAHACDSIQNQQFSVEDFISPHEGNVHNAHIYHTEISGQGHLPPKQLSDIKQRLDLLKDIECEWWTIEIKDPDKLLFTKRIIDHYVSEQDSENNIASGG